MLSLQITKHLKASKTVFKAKTIYFFAYSLYVTLSFLNDLYFRVKIIFKTPNAPQNFFLNQDEKNNRKLIPINLRKEVSATKENINWKRA